MADTLIQGTTIIEDKRSEKGQVWSAPGTAFLVQGNNEVVDRGSVTLSVTDNGTALFLPVYLPNGVSITSVIVHGNAAATAETYTLRKVSTTGALTTIGTANIGTADTTLSDNIIDNANFSYNIDTSTLDLNDAIFGAIIKYEF